MNANMVIVTGCFGAPVVTKAKELSRELDLPLVELDKEIEARDGRTIRRLVMMNGEHGYRNAEFEILQELAENGQPCVVACGDGVLYDDDSRGIICENQLVIAGADLSEEQLWENASRCRDSYHAFMSFGTEEEKRNAFRDLIRRQRLLFEGALK
jgi:shikimate kinase